MIPRFILRSALYVTEFIRWSNYGANFRKMCARARARALRVHMCVFLHSWTAYVKDDGPLPAIRDITSPRLQRNIENALLGETDISARVQVPLARFNVRPGRLDVIHTFDRAIE